MFKRKIAVTVFLLVCALPPVDFTIGRGQTSVCGCHDHIFKQVFAEPV